jgi:nucleotide-binding universal stress UspA family protein
VVGIMISKILAAVDTTKSSDAVFDAALQLAKASCGKLLVIHVIKPLTTGVYYYDTAITEEFLDALEEEGRTLLSRYADKARELYGIEIEPIVEHGSPVEAILKTATIRKVDLIIIGSRGIRGARQFFIGSIPNSIVHQAGAPVLVVR